MTTQNPPAARSELVAALGRWDLTTLVVNTVIGGGIFGLPMLVAGLLGTSSLLAYVAAAGGIGVIVLCFAEVSAQFRSAGGPYLYAREAFGSFVGLQVGGVTWLMRISATGANANLFVMYLAMFWPAAQTGVVRWIIITALFAIPTIINVRGVKQGIRHSGGDSARSSDVALVSPLLDPFRSMTCSRTPPTGNSSVTRSGRLPSTRALQENIPGPS